MKIRDLMSRKIACLSAEDTVAGTPDMDLDRCCGEKQIRRLPIVENNSLAGLVSLKKEGHTFSLEIIL